MSICVRSVDEVKRTESTPRVARERTRAATITPMHAQQQIEVDLRRLRHQGECERPVGRWRAVGATGSWMPVPGSLDPLTSTTEELCGCLGRGSTGPSSRRAGRGPGHKTRVAAPAGEPGASHKGRLGGRLRQQWQSRRAVGDGKLCRAGQELRRNVRAVHEQHSQLFRAQAQFSSSGNAVSDSSAAPARAYPGLENRGFDAGAWCRE